MTVGLESCNEAVGVLHVTHSIKFFPPFLFFIIFMVGLGLWIADLGLLVLSITWAAPHGGPHKTFPPFSIFVASPD